MLVDRLLQAWNPSTCRQQVRGIDFHETLCVVHIYDVGSHRAIEANSRLTLQLFFTGNTTTRNSSHLLVATTHGLHAEMKRLHSNATRLKY
jgi:hypothetical protein